MGKSFKDLKKRNNENQSFEKKVKKMEPYTKDGEYGKFENTPNSRGIITKNSKEIVKNANRAKKKSVRQQNKINIQNLNDYLEIDSEDDFEDEI